MTLRATALSNDPAIRDWSPRGLPGYRPNAEPGRLDARREPQRAARSAGAAQARLHAVAAVLFGAIERDVGAIDERRSVHRLAGNRGGDADARGDANRPANRAHLELLDRVAHRFGNPEGVVDRRIGQDHQELVAAEPAAHVALAQHAVQPGADRRQHGVARDVAVAVVDRLEAVEVDHQHRHLKAGARRRGAGWPPSSSIACARVKQPVRPSRAQACRRFSMAIRFCADIASIVVAHSA